MSIIKFNNKFKKALFEKINSLSSTEHEEIYRIINDNNVNISRNRNGIFFNISSVDDDIVDQIATFVDYCISNKDQLDEYDKKLNECKLSNKYGQVIDMNIKLEHLGVNDKQRKQDDWSKVKIDAKNVNKFITFVEKFNEDRDKLYQKKINSKFINAKKKYSRKITVEKKFEYEHIDELHIESYLL